jgi:hypothetical protein
MFKQLEEYPGARRSGRRTLQKCAEKYFDLLRPEKSRAPPEKEIRPAPIAGQSARRSPAP